MLRCLRLAPLLLLGLFGCRPKTSAPPPSTEASSAAPGGALQAKPLTIRFDGEPEVVAAPLPGVRRGVNLGNGFDAPQEGAWGVILEEKHFDMVKEAGLDHVRLPVRFSAHAEATAPYTIDPAFFARVDWAVDAALARGLSIVVDLHHYEELMKEPDAHLDRAVALWEQIAARYADRPPAVLFELLNEPCDQLDPKKYNGLLARLIPAVRATNPTRPLIVDSYFWAAASYLKSLELPSDPNVIVSFHMYQPILFTHQGASWMSPEFQSRGLLFPGPGPAPQLTPEAQSTLWVRQWMENYVKQPADKNPSSPRAVAAEFDMVTRYVKETGRRVYLGEFGAIDYADPVSRENYLRLVRREAERRGFAWAIWDDGGRNQAMDVKNGRWIEPVWRALFEDQPRVAHSPEPNASVD